MEALELTQVAINFVSKCSIYCDMHIYTHGGISV